MLKKWFEKGQGIMYRYQQQATTGRDDQVSIQMYIFFRIFSKLGDEPSLKHRWLLMSWPFGDVMTIDEVHWSLSMSHAFSPEH